MLVSIHTDKNIQGRIDVAQTVESIVEEALAPFSDWLTRCDVHLSDENGNKGGGDDKKCTLDVGVKGSSNISSHHTAATVRDAIDGALDKMSGMLEKIHDKRVDKQQRPGTIKVPVEAFEE